MVAGEEQTQRTATPSRSSGAWFALRRTLLQVRRLALDAVHPPKRHGRGILVLPTSHERRTKLFITDSAEERRMELGKIQNLRLVARLLNGIEVPAGEVFSFWRHVGRCTRRRGFVVGRQIQEGCLMPAVGGGICQLTNALYAAAVDARLEIVERHPHTMRVPGAAGPDATVAWNYIDLRLRSDRPFRIDARVTPDELVVRICVPERGAAQPLRVIAPDRPDANSCETCGENDCHHWGHVDRREVGEKTAILADQWTPEFTALGSCDLLLRPLDGKRWNRPQFAWPTSLGGEVCDFPILALRGGLRQRRLAEQGAARQSALLEGAQQLAAAYGKRLPYDVTHLVISQSLLPFLWLEGVLGGRTFEVLMARLPMAEIHRRLDEAAEAHPERKLLSDFRAPQEIVEAEMEALGASTRNLTCHSDIAARVPNASLLDWTMPLPKIYRPGRTIVFPGPTAARKGAYEVREAALALGLEVVLLGSELEGPDFWAGVSVRRMRREDQWLDGALAVVQPALLEDRPTALLRAIASGCPVIATAACGIPSQPLLTIVPAGDPDALRDALGALIASEPLLDQ